MERKWWKEAIIYQVYPRSFKDSNGDGIGDIPGIIEKLDYLKDFGIDVIWLSPVYQSPNCDNGYDISDYYDIMSEFGTMKDIKLLINEMHQRGLKLVMDLVVNHSSDEHAWFAESKASKDNPYRDYYIWRKSKGNNPPNNWGSVFGGSAWEYDSKTDEYYLHLFAKKQPDLNWENPALREEIYKMMTFWLDSGVDGFRMDVINMISKAAAMPDGKVVTESGYGDGSPYYINGPRVHEYLKEMNKKVLSKYDVMTVGETPGVTPEIAMQYVSEERKELNMLFQFELVCLGYGETKWDRVEWRLTDMKKIFKRWYEGLKDGGWNSMFLNNHDEPRMVSHFGNDKQYRAESAKMLATLLLTMPGTSYIYQGEEIGMTNVEFENIEDYRDIEILNWYDEQKKKDVPEKEILKAIYWMGRDNARTPMQWNGSPNAGFTTGEPWIKCNPNYKEINVDMEVSNNNSIFNYYKEMIRIRKQNPGIIYGDFNIILENDESLFCYTRSYNEEILLVILNFYGNERTFHLPENLQYKNSEQLTGNYKISKNDSIQEIKLKPYEARLYRLSK